MSQNTVLASVASIVALILIVLLFSAPPEIQVNPLIGPPPLQEESLYQNSNNEGQQEERISYDLLRLRDPATGLIPPDIRSRELDFAKDLPLRSSTFYQEQKNAVSFDGWTSRGPFNVGGRVRALAFDVSDPTHQTLLAGGVSGGMWRTTDDGQNWTKVTAPWQLNSVSCVVQDTRPGHQNVWYYGSGEGRASSPSQGGDTYRGDGIFKSVDGGQSWDLLPATSTDIPQESDQPFDFIWNIVTNPAQLDFDEVYAACAGLIYRSADGGDSWEAVLGDPGQLAQYTDIAITSEGVLFAAFSYDGGQHGVFRSTDGLQWTDITPSMVSGHTRIVLAVAPGNENYLFITASPPSGSSFTELHRYQYISGDGSGSGGFWINLSSSITQMPHPYYGTFPYYTQRGYNQCTAVRPGNLLGIYLGGVHMWRSTNGFANGSQAELIGGWTVADHHADVHKIIFQPGSDLVAYTASDGGVHKTLDITAEDVDWISLNHGLHTTQFYTVAIDEAELGNDLIVGGTQDNGTLWTGSDDGTYPWTQPLGGDGSYCAIVSPGGIFGGPAEYYLSWYFANIMRTFLDTDGHEIESTKVTPAGLESTDFLFINPFIIDPNEESMMFLASRYGIYRNDDLTEIPMGSVNPTSINWVHLTTQPNDEKISALAISKTENRVLYYGSSVTGRLYRLDGANTAAPGTLPELLSGNAGFPPGGYISSISIHPDDDQKVLIAYANYMVESLWYTEDSGASWANVEGNLAGDDGPSIRAAKIMPLEGTDFWFIGTSTGIYSAVYEAGSPMTWQQEADEVIGNVIVDALATRPADGLLVAATHGMGIFSATIVPASDVPVVKPTAILDQNVPNPFNPQTTISYTLPSESRVRLQIFDVAGRLVRILRNGSNEDAGLHEVLWDGRDGHGRNVASGTFLYRLDAGLFSETKTMVLVR